MLNRLISTMNLKTKAILFLLALLLPFCTVLVISLTALWQRTHAVLDNELTKAEHLIMRSVDHYKTHTAIWAKIIADNHLIRQAVHLNDVGGIRNNIQHLFADLKPSHIIVYDKNGIILHHLAVYLPQETEQRRALIADGLNGSVIIGINNNGGHILIETFHPVFHTNIDHLLVGYVCVGYHFNDAFARNLKQICGIDNILIDNARIVASSFDTQPVRIRPKQTSAHPERTLFQVGKKEYDTAAMSFEGKTHAGLRLYAALDNSEIKKTLNQTILTFFLAFVSVSAVGALIALGIARRVVRSASILIDHAKALSEKQFDRMIELETRDEFAELGRTFNMMSQRLKDSFVKIETQSADLAATKTYLNHVIDSIPSLLIGTNRKGEIHILNQPARASCAHIPFKAGVTTFDELLEDYSPAVVKKIGSAIKDQHRIRIENMNTVFNQKTVFHNITVFPIVDNRNGDSMIRIDDVTEQVLLESQLRQSQKMESIGRLAGGIAHDFNNILSGIFGYSQLALNNADRPEKLKAHLTQITKSAQRAAELIQQILTFSRRSEYQKRPLKMYLEIKETLKLLRSTIPTTIDIQTDLRSKSMVLADPTKIHQVVMNLCTNAYHAMRETGGKLTVALSDVEIPESGQFFKQRVPPGNYLLLRVQDTGTGMDAVTQAKAFEPYYTTRSTGQGTGLGLSIVQAIIDEHDGFMELVSELGKGSTFSVYFPAAPGEKSDIPQENETQPLPCGSGTIMVVDDEESIRNLFNELLKECGYTVHLFTNGRDALAAFENSPRAYDLIITDMTMPGITGDELARKIMALQPDIPIFLCTGFSEHMTEIRAMDMGIKQFFQKPVDIRKLITAVDQILNHPAHEDGSHVP
jgi:signal transduction histidine kinase/ActR/RegA family two-component response regulator/HAMP domain-containing protein